MRFSAFIPPNHAQTSTCRPIFFPIHYGHQKLVLRFHHTGMVVRVCCRSCTRSKPRCTKRLSCFCTLLGNVIYRAGTIGDHEEIEQVDTIPSLAMREGAEKRNSLCNGGRGRGGAGGYTCVCALVSCTSPCTCSEPQSWTAPMLPPGQVHPWANISRDWCRRLANERRHLDPVL